MNWHKLKTGACVLAACLLVSGMTSLAGPTDSPLDLRSIPISEWLNASQIAEIPWNIEVRDASLRMDQRLEVVYSAKIRSKELNRMGNRHELFLISRVSSPDGEWLNAPAVLHHDVDKELPPNMDLQFNMRMFVQPGDYVLWLVLYDRSTNKHDFAKRRIRIPEIHRDPLPNAFSGLPLIEFPQNDPFGEGGILAFSSPLYLPVTTKSPIEMELISTLSPPEQWNGRRRMVRSHNDYTVGALAALSQVELSKGSISITGLDLARREVAFEQRNFHQVDWRALATAFKKADSPEITTTALEGSKNNGAFFRDYLNQRLTSDAAQGATGGDRQERPLRILIVVTSPRLFEKGSDLKPISLEGDCRCRIYHLRFRLNLADVFDELEKFMKPLHPRTFNLLTPEDLRKAIAEILEDLRNL